MGKWLLLVGLIGCGGAVQAGADGGSEDAAVVVHKDAGVDVSEEPPVMHVDAGYPGPHPAVPQVQTNGGPVLTAPNVVPVFFMNDSAEPTLEDFLQQLTTSAFWGQATKEYGVGPINVAKSIVVTDTPPTNIDEAGIESWLASYLDGTHPEWPAVAQNNIYTVFYPAQTTITIDQFGQSCVGFGGYHYTAKGAMGSSIVYAVIPRCSGFGQLTAMDATTSALSHELYEASSDPLLGDPAYSYVDLDHMVWNLMPLGEIGDMCAYEPQSYQRLVGSYMVQRPWSNASALAGHDPCVPVLSAPYFNAAPMLTEDVTLDYYGQQVPTKGVQIPLNQSKTIDVQLFSDAPVSDWTVQATDSSYGTTKPQELQFSWDRPSGNNGDTLHLTITRVANGQYGGSEFIIWSQRGLTSANLWFGFVSN